MKGGIAAGHFAAVLLRRTLWTPNGEFRRLRGSDDLFTIRVGDHFRALGVMEADTITSSLPVLVNPATRANLRDDDIKALHLKKDSKAAGSCRSPVAPALHRFRVLGVERIDLQLFELLLQPFTGRRVAPLQVFFGCPR
jgi:hypothetical protein